MVAAGDDVGPGFEKLAADLVGDTEAGGRVLAVHDDEVEAEALAQPREMRRNSIAARPADHIPAEQNSHEPYAFLAGCAPPLGAAPASVTTRSSGWSVASRGTAATRSEEHTSELQSLMRISYAVFCLKIKKYAATTGRGKHLHTYTS